jgi:hypothetical protein
MTSDPDEVIEHRSCFCPEWSAAENFAILRYIIETTTKNNQNVSGALSFIAGYRN